MVGMGGFEVVSKCTFVSAHIMLVSLVSPIASLQFGSASSHSRREAHWQHSEHCLAFFSARGRVKTITVCASVCCGQTARNGVTCITHGNMHYLAQNSIGVQCGQPTREPMGFSIHPVARTKYHDMTDFTCRTGS